MLIRPAQPDDADAITHVQITTWRTTYPGIVPDHTLAKLNPERTSTYWRGVIEQRDNPVRVFVAEDEAGIMGFANGGPEREQNPTYTGELYAIYVLQAYHRQGIGRALVQTVAGELLQQQHTAMLLWMLEANPSRRFYERLGGQPVLHKMITIGDTELPEVAYGWTDIRTLL